MKIKGTYLVIALLVGALLFFSFKPEDTTPEYLQITAIESVVPGGLGRSRLVSVDSKGGLEEEKLKNFFSMVGINFGNIRENDQSITKKITELTLQGWELESVNTGVYAADKSTGIFITRYLFKK
jgi:hypothetical protein